MGQVIRIDPEQDDGSHQSAFVTLFTREGRPFRDHKHLQASAVIAPMFLMQFREDGMKGFFGGSVEKHIGESFSAAARREFKEETGFELPSDVAFQHVCSHTCDRASGGQRGSHFYAAEVSFDFLLDVMVAINAHMKQEFFETHGAMLITAMCQPGYSRWLPNLLASPMPDSTGEQVLSLLETYDMVDHEALSFLSAINAQRSPVPVYPKLAAVG